MSVTQIQNLPFYSTFQEAVYAQPLSIDVPLIFRGKSETFSEKDKKIILALVLAYIVPILRRSN